MKLFVVEAPYKLERVRQELKKVVHTPFRVVATRGHLLDLPSKQTGFTDGKPVFYPIDEERIERLVQACKGVDQVYIMTDPDREGEAIAHEVLGVVLRILPRNRVYRIRPLALVAPEIERAMEGLNTRKPSERFQVNADVVRAAMSRRVIDRLIGYTYSALAQNALKKKTVSIGRVKTAVLRYLASNPFRSSFSTVCVLALGFEGVTVMRGVIRAHGSNLNFDQGWGVIRKINSVGMGKSSKPVNTARLMASFALRGGLSGALSAYKAAQSLYQRGVLSYPRTREEVYTEYAVDFARDLCPRTEYVPQLPDSGHEAIRPVEWVSDAFFKTEQERQVYDFVKKNFLETVEGKEGVYLDVALQIGDSLVPAQFYTDNPETLQIFPNAAAWMQLKPIHSRQRAADLFTWMDENRVGTPATYASSVQGLLDREYVSASTTTVTPEGRGVVEWAGENVPWLDAETSVRLEAYLAEIEQGKMSAAQAFRLLQDLDEDEENRKIYEETSKLDLAQEVLKQARHFAAGPSVSL